MEITFTIPDSTLLASGKTVTAIDIINAYADAHNYPVEVMGEPNPESRVQYAKRMIRQHIKDNYNVSRIKGEAVRIQGEANEILIT